MTRRTLAGLTAAAGIALAAGALGITPASAAPHSAVISVSAELGSTPLGTSPAPVTLTAGGTETIAFTEAGGDGQALTWSAAAVTGGYEQGSLLAVAGGETVTVNNPAVLPAAGTVTVSVTDGTDTTVATVNIASGTQVTADLSQVRSTAASAVPHLSRGHAVAVASTREDVAFTSDKATWVYFTIVGPGAIDGHQGWVDAADGLNQGVYTGLEYNHGYAVYFTPVAAQGSTVPVAGARTGHVYFVTGK